MKWINQKCKHGKFYKVHFLILLFAQMKIRSAQKPPFYDSQYNTWNWVESQTEACNTLHLKNGHLKKKGIGGFYDTFRVDQRHDTILKCKWSSGHNDRIGLFLVWWLIITRITCKFGHWLKDHRNFIFVLVAICQKSANCIKS